MSQLVPFLNFGLEESVLCPESDFMYGFDGAFDRSKMYITLEGLNSGVPTRTTPTLTPTTLRNIEQTFIELQSKPEPHENEAGFVPPLVQLIGNNQYSSLSSDDVYSNKSQSIWQSSLSQSSSDSNTRSTPPLAPNTNLINNTPPSGRRNMGGRKPAKDVNVSPEEEERRRVRRERNKAAAARCRKRRVDHTNQLIKETEELEDKKRELERHIEELNGVRDELEFLLQTHKSSPGMCRRRPGSPPDIKPSLLAPQPYGLPPVSVSSAHHHQQQQEPKIKTEEDHQHHQQQQQHHHQQQQQQHSHQHHHHQLQHDVDPDMFPLPSAKRVMLSQTVPICKPSRPNTLNVGLSGAKTLALSELAGIPISTPSSGLQFNFDSLMGGGTGLTPVSAPLVPSCSTQQRHVPTSTADIMSPDTCGSIKLVSL